MDPPTEPTTGRLARGLARNLAQAAHQSPPVVDKVATALSIGRLRPVHGGNNTSFSPGFSCRKNQRIETMRNIPNREQFWIIANTSANNLNHPQKRDRKIATSSSIIGLFAPQKGGLLKTRSQDCNIVLHHRLVCSTKGRLVCWANQSRVRSMNSAVISCMAHATFSSSAIGDLSATSESPATGHQHNRNRNTQHRN
jgi:hypothetical protein